MLAVKPPQFDALPFLGNYSSLALPHFPAFSTFSCIAAGHEHIQTREYEPMGISRGQTNGALRAERNERNEQSKFIPLALCRKTGPYTHFLRLLHQHKPSS